MSEVTIYHNPNCSTSRHAIERAADAGIAVDEVRYLKTPLDREGLEHLASILEDPVTDLVRRDAQFKKLGLTDADVADTEQVVSVLTEHPRLMQRPVLVKGNTAIIGRPKDRVPTFLAG